MQRVQIGDLGQPGWPFTQFMKYQVTILTALASVTIAISSHTAFSCPYHRPTKEDDKAFFGAMHLGLDLDQCETNYHQFGNVDVTWHSGAPESQEYVEFRLITHPQRRIYVYCQTATKKIVSVSYEKSGQDETFFAEEIQFLTDLNQGQGPLKTAASLGRLK